MACQPSLELSMIVRDGARSLARCLASVEGLVDRITVGDTGSSDASPRIARQFGASVLTVPWQGDFAAARNAVLAAAEADWVLVLDADELLDAKARAMIPSLLVQDEIAAYDVWCWNYVPAADFRAGGQLARHNPGTLEEARAYPAYFPSRSMRLFRRQAGLHFEHCVHETVSHRVAALGLQSRPAPFVIHHLGYVEDAPERREAKGATYHPLVLAKLAAAPDNYQANLEAGMSELDHARRPAAALPYFEAACRLAPHAATAWMYAGLTLLRLGNKEAAGARLEHARRLDDGSPLIHGAQADLWFAAGAYDEALEGYRRARARGDASALTLAKQGACLVQLGQADAGITNLEEALVQAPGLPALYELLATTALLAGRPATACKAAAHRLEMPSLRSFHYILAAAVHQEAGQPARASEILHAGLQRHPGDADLGRELVRLVSGNAARAASSVGSAPLATAVRSA